MLRSAIIDTWKAFNMSGTLAGRRGLNAKLRFCNECGTRPLPGEFRYELGVYWMDESGREILRCKICKDDREAPKEYRSGICIACATWEDQWLERGDDRRDQTNQAKKARRRHLKCHLYNSWLYRRNLSSKSLTTPDLVDV